MRLLVLYQASNAAADHPGFFEAFDRLVSEGSLGAHVGIPFVGVAARKGWGGLWAEAEQIARSVEAEAVFLHFFHASMPDPTRGILRLKNLPSRPTMFTSLGDPYGHWTNRIPKSFRVASALADVSFLTGMGSLARQLRGWGSRNLVLMPHGCCQVRFSSPANDGQVRRQFDVAFIGSRIRSRNALGYFHRVARKRVEFVEAVTKRYGRRFGLFGHGWEGNPVWQGPIPPHRQVEAYRRSAVALGGMPNAFYDFYTSDRPFIAIASGVPFVDYWVKGVDCLLAPGRDWWLARTQEEMFGLCDQLLEMPNEERIRLGEAAREQVLTHHTQYHRCREMISIVKSIRDARLSGQKAPLPKLEFLASSHAQAPFPESIVGWEG